MMKTLVTIIFAAGALGVCWICAGAIAGGDRAEGPAHWSYRDEAAWADLGPDAGACVHGLRQSPIDLSTAQMADEPDLRFRYLPGVADEWNNGHTLEVSSPDNERAFVGDAEMRLVQAHFHDPSEHAIDGVRLPLEMHLVHRAADNSLVVIAVLFREGRPHAALATLWRAMPGPRDKGAHRKVRFDPAEFLPADMAHFDYEGSLTTPPCTEGVRWLVFQTPVEASARQIATFREAFGENARPLKPRNGREVHLGE